MNSGFYCVYLVLSILFNLAGTFTMYFVWTSKSNQIFDTNYIVAISVTGVNLVVCIFGFAFVCIGEGSSSTSFKNCAGITLYILAILLTAGEVAGGYMFENTIQSVFYTPETSLLYLVYASLYVALVIARALITDAFCLLAARDLQKSETASGFVMYQNVMGQDYGFRMMMPAFRFPQ